MSNFVTGLVRRGAGLPSPVAIRPAIVPGHMAHTATMTDDGEPITEQASGAPVTSSVETSPQKAKFPDRMESVPPPVLAVPRPTEVRAPEVLRKESARITGSQIESAVPQSSTHSAVAQETSSGVLLHPAPSISYAGLPEAANQSETQNAGHAQATDHARSDSQQPDQPKLSAIEPARQQPLEVARPTQPVAVLPQTATREATRETHNIQVKIGKVEIRSTQPVPVVQAPRRTGTSGFEDLKMARSYFNRAQG